MRGAFDLDPDPVFDAALECRETTECERAGDGHGFQTDRSLQTAGLGNMRPDLRIGNPGARSLVENGRNDMHAVRTGGHAAVHPRFGVALGVAAHCRGRHHAQMREQLTPARAAGTERSAGAGGGEGGRAGGGRGGGRSPGRCGPVGGHTGEGGGGGMETKV